MNHLARIVARETSPEQCGPKSKLLVSLLLVYVDTIHKDQGCGPFTVRVLVAIVVSLSTFGTSFPVSCDSIAAVTTSFRGAYPLSTFVMNN